MKGHVAASLGPAFRPISLVTLIAAVLSVGVWAQGGLDARVLSVEFDPPRFVPGDEVAAYMALDAGSSKWRPETVASGFESSGESEPTVLSLELRAKGGNPVLIVRFIAWAPGRGVLPPFAVGGLAVPSVGFECGSALESGDRGDPEPLPQLKPPGLVSKAYLIAGIGLFIIVLSLVVVAKILPWIRTLLARWAFLRARNDFEAALGSVAKSGDSGPAAWAALCLALRRFVSIRSGRDWMPLTTGEVEGLPPDCLPGGVCPDALVILGRGDAVRFAGRRGIDIGAAISLARSLADRLDEALSTEAESKSKPGRVKGSDSP